MALLVLESLWAFQGLLWPESGELLPIAEALQQGVISGDLARRILNQRHLIGALYLPETSRVVPLDQAEEVVDTKVGEILRQTQIPDVLPNMIQSGSPTLNRLSWGSTSSSSPPASPLGISCDPSFMKGVGSVEQAEHRLLFHLMTCSYVDAHSGQRLVLLEPELAELASAVSLDPGETGPRGGVAESMIDPVGTSPSTQRLRDRDDLGSELSWSDTEEQGNAEIMEIQDGTSKCSIFGKDITPWKKGDGDDGPVSKLGQQSWKKGESPESAAHSDQTKRETEQISDLLCGAHMEITDVPKTVEKKREAMDNITPEIEKEGKTEQRKELVCPRMLSSGRGLVAIPPAASDKKSHDLEGGQSRVEDGMASIKEETNEVLSEFSAMDAPVIEFEQPKRAPGETTQHPEETDQCLVGAGVRHAGKEIIHQEWRDIKMQEAETKLNQFAERLKQTGPPRADKTTADRHMRESMDAEIPLMIVEDDDQVTVSLERVLIKNPTVQGDTKQKSQTVQLVESGLLDRAELLRTAKQALKVRKEAGRQRSREKGIGAQWAGWGGCREAGEGRSYPACKLRIELQSSGRFFRVE